MKRSLIFLLFVVLCIGAFTRQTKMPEPWQISDGTTGWDHINKFGHNPDVDATEDLWHGVDHGGAAVYPFPASAVSLFISSDIAGDTEDITLQLLDSSGNKAEVTTTLAGLTFTAVSGGTYLMVNRAFNDDGTDLVGTIYIHTDSVDGNADGIPDIPATQLLATIEIGDGQTQNTPYKVPNNFTGYLEQWCWGVVKTSVGGAEKEADVDLMTRENGKVFRVRNVFPANNRGTGHSCKDLKVPIRLPELTDVKLRATPATADTAVTGTFFIRLKPDVF